MRFREVQYFFLPTLGPDSFSGFMGFYLSSREGVQDLDSWQIVLFGPKGLKALLHASTFADDYFTNVQVIEFPDNLEAPSESEGEMIVDEESKDASKAVKLEFVEETQRIAYRDQNLTVYPVRARSAANPSQEVYSFVCVPE